MSKTGDDTSLLCITKTPRSRVIDLLKTEDSLRRSHEVQLTYDTLHDEIGFSSEIIEDYVQRKTLQKLGYIPSLQNLSEYRTIRQHYCKDSEVMNSVMYLKYAHLYKPCPIVLGRQAPNAVLCDLLGKKRMLMDFAKKKPLVIMAGSIT
jgi:hypothetical protein